MKNDFLTDEIISDYFMGTKPMCRVLDQRLATNFDLSASFDIDELRDSFMEDLESIYDKKLFNILRGKFHKFYDAYQGVWDFTKFLIEDEIIELDEEGISFEDVLYQNYLDFRTNINDIMFEVTYDIACEKICNSELVTAGTSQEAQRMLDTLQSLKPKGEC